MNGYKVLKWLWYTPIFPVNLSTEKRWKGAAFPASFPGTPRKHSMGGRERKISAISALFRTQIYRETQRQGHFRTLSPRILWGIIGLFKPDTNIQTDPLENKPIQDLNRVG